METKVNKKLFMLARPGDYNGDCRPIGLYRLSGLIKRLRKEISNEILAITGFSYYLYVMAPNSDWDQLTDFSHLLEWEPEDNGEIMCDDKSYTMEELMDYLRS